jgi:RNA polymerase sigma-70 factor (ECF subfamily)
MDRYASGDERAFDRLHQLAARRLRNFLLRLSGSRAIADELLQETFFRIHRARGSFKQGSTALLWMMAIARNVYIDHVRKHRAQPAKNERVEELRTPAPSPEDAAATHESMLIIRRALAMLPLSQREAFVLFRFEQMSAKEAAVVLGATESAVKLRVFRATEMLRAALLGEDQR